jgi:hypothetical protein
MRDETSPAEAWAPQACTLPTAQRPLRLAEFDALFARATRDARRLGPRHLRLTLAGPAALEAIVRDLTARESECCSFFEFAVSAPEPGTVRLDVKVPAAYTDMLDGLAGRASTVRSGR